MDTLWSVRLTYKIITNTKGFPYYIQHIMKCKVTVMKHFHINKAKIKGGGDLGGNIFIFVFVFFYPLLIYV